MRKSYLVFLFIALNLIYCLQSEAQLRLITLSQKKHTFSGKPNTLTQRLHRTKNRALAVLI